MKYIYIYTHQSYIYIQLISWDTLFSTFFGNTHVPKMIVLVSTMKYLYCQFLHILTVSWYSFFTFCTKHSILCAYYGVKAFYSSKIQLVTPLTKEKISINNGGGGDWDTISCLGVKSSAGDAKLALVLGRC